MHSASDPAVEPDAPITWDWILGQLTQELDDVVAEFLREFRATEPYPSDQVAQQDIVDTARQTFELLIRRLRGESDPPGAAGLIERLAARRAQQGVPLATFLRAVRIDFRVIWVHVQRIAGEQGSAVLARNVVHLLDTVEDYVDALREAYRAEEARLDRTLAAQRHRTILRLFSGEPLTGGETELLAGRLRMRADARYEVIAVTGEAIHAMIARYGKDPLVGSFESVSAIVLFREQTAPERWRREVSSAGAYVGDVDGLAAVPRAAEVALQIARHAPAGEPVLATEDEVWATVALQHLREVFPRHAREVPRSLAALPAHERARLIQAVRTYLRTGSIKATAERLFCHRNTVINRLRAFADATGYDPTVPLEAAWIVVALAPEPGTPNENMQTHNP
ncbi:helix-turn-helix domain-containing protein [Leucobacter weissii]|uniref:Helix-turn-helix domain-containing protein n=1 Tax=Leucobacter weissii TaxID=1983706 RepID=A0A939MNX5_9MICO|nr:helix-turn-helix domain-containing protein [Leucobacter weissii]MBO1900379.1 helix-turn-helix domain-containing protein [Leucobacter weissii]